MDVGRKLGAANLYSNVKRNIEKGRHYLVASDRENSEKAPKSHRSKRRLSLTESLPEVNANKLWGHLRENIGTFLPERGSRFRKKPPPPYMVDPDSHFKGWWDIWLSILVAYTTIIVPYRVCFNIDAEGFFFYFEHLLDIFFMLEILINFRTGVIDPTTGQVRFERGIIVKSYLKGWFFIDLLSAINLEVFLFLSSSSKTKAIESAKLVKGLKILRLLKIFRVRKIGDILKKVEDGVFTNQSLLSLIKIIMSMLLASHLMACVWFSITLNDPKNSWAAKSGLLEHPDLHYISSIYWALATMTTVGYGDIVAYNNIEHLTAICVMVIGVSLFGYVIGNISSLVENIDASGRMYTEKMTLVKEYIISRNLPKLSSKLIRQHFEYYYQHKSVFNEKEIFDKLPTTIRNEVIHFVMKSNILKLNFLSLYHESLVCDLVIEMHPFCANCEDSIYFQYELAAHVFFLLKGNVALNKSFSNKIEDSLLAVIEPRNHFGELELFSKKHGNGIRVCSAYAKGYCELLFLSRSQITKIGVKWPELVIYFENMAEQFAKTLVHRARLKSTCSAVTAFKPKRVQPNDEIPNSNKVVPIDSFSESVIDPVAHHVKLEPINKSLMISKPPKPDSRIESFIDQRVEDTDDLENLDENEIDHLANQSGLLRPSTTENLSNEINRMKKKFILHSRSDFLVRWEAVLTLVILYASIVVPFRIGFDTDASGFFSILEFAMDIYFGIDIILNFRTTFFDKDMILVYDSKLICYHYLKGWFLIDLLSTLPVESIGRLFLSEESNVEVALRSAKLLRMLKLAKLLKLMRLLKLGTVLKKIKDVIQFSPSVEKLIKLVIIMVFVAHWNACVFHFVMIQADEDGGKNWCTDYFFGPEIYSFRSCIDNISNMDRYIAAMYWAFTTMTTVGFGDTKPHKYSSSEILTSMASMLMNSTVFAYVISGILSVIQNFDPSEREFKLKMTEMKDYVRESSMNYRLSLCVKRHYDYMLSRSCLFPEQEIMDKMMPSLRFDVARIITDQNLLIIPLISEIERAYKGFVSYALFMFNPLFILRGERVCGSGAQGKEMFFLLTGQCEQLHCSTYNARIIVDNAQFEEYAMLAPSSENYRTSCTVTTLSVSCELYSISKKNFRKLNYLSPAIYKYFKMRLAESISSSNFLQMDSNQQKVIDEALAFAKDFPSRVGKRKPMNSIMDVALAKLREVTGALSEAEKTKKSLPQKDEKLEESSGSTNNLTEIESINIPAKEHK